MKKNTDSLSTRIITGISACIGTIMLAIIVFSGKTIWDLNNRLTKLEPNVNKIAESVKTSDAELRRAEEERRRQYDQSTKKWLRMSSLDEKIDNLRVKVGILEGKESCERH